MLPVQVGHVHLIKVNKVEMSHSCPGQEHRYMRTQPSKTGHCYLCIPQLLYFFPGTPGKKGILQFFPGWEPFLHKISLLLQN